LPGRGRCVCLEEEGSFALGYKANIYVANVAMKNGLSEPILISHSFGPNGEIGYDELEEISRREDGSVYECEEDAEGEDDDVTEALTDAWEKVKRKFKRKLYSVGVGFIILGASLIGLGLLLFIVFELAFDVTSLAPISVSALGLAMIITGLECVTSCDLDLDSEYKKNPTKCIRHFTLLWIGMSFFAGIGGNPLWITSIPYIYFLVRRDEVIRQEARYKKATDLISYMIMLMLLGFGGIFLQYAEEAHLGKDYGFKLCW
jgi:hypothetical protein